MQVECVAENAHGDPVTARAALKIYDGECWSVMIMAWSDNYYFYSNPHIFMAENLKGGGHFNIKWELALCLPNCKLIPHSLCNNT